MPSVSLLLVIEDDRDTNAVLVEVLRDEGYRCTTTFSGEWHFGCSHEIALISSCSI